MYSDRKKKSDTSMYECLKRYFAREDFRVFNEITASISALSKSLIQNESIDWIVRIIARIILNPSWSCAVNQLGCVCSRERKNEMILEKSYLWITKLRAPLESLRPGLRRNCAAWDGMCSRMYFVRRKIPGQIGPTRVLLIFLPHK